LGISAEHVLPFFSLLYVLIAAALFLQRPQWLLALRQGASVAPLPAEPAEAQPCTEGPVLVYKTPHCKDCEFRKAAAAAKKAELTSE